MNSAGRNNHALVMLRRDLRLQDNRALDAACKNFGKVSLCFILDPAQLHPHRWKSQPGLSFMRATLRLLHEELRAFGSGLIIACGSPEKVLEELIPKHGFDAVFANRDYTPFALQRDQKIEHCCLILQTPMHWFDDALLHTPGDILNSIGKPYRVFTPFFRAASKINLCEPLTRIPLTSLSEMDANTWQKNCERLLSIQAEETQVKAGRKVAESILADMDTYANYQQLRDLAALDATTHLSVHLKFGTISVREVYVAIFQYLGSEHPLLRQLYWRDFFTHIAFFFPHVFGHAFDARFETIAWSEDQQIFQAWCQGRTGFPIVDAGMRELLQTGFMHNRVRMITASFLVKDLHIDWRMGEAWFARHLVDYDPAVNNGNWQWAASTGCDAQPWFRIFNPWLQQQRFDNDCSYIKRWLPALADIDAVTIHHWFRDGNPALHPLPILDHKIEAAKAKQLYKQAVQEINYE